MSRAALSRVLSRQAWWRDAAAVACLIVLCLAFFWRMAFTDLILPRGDAFTYFYPYWAYRDQLLRAGQVPLWNPYLFMGAPFLANSQAGVLYPLNWPLIWLDAPTAVKAAAVFHIALATVGAFVFGRRTLSLSVLAATLTGATFALGGYLTAQLEHINQLQGLAWLPWIFWLWDEAADRKRWKALLWLGLAIAMQLLAGHTQSAFITGFGVGVFALWHVLQLLPRSWRTVKEQWRQLAFWRQALWPLIPLVAATALALGLAAAQILPTLELAGLSNRSGGLPFIEALSFSLRPTLLGRAFLPEYSHTSLFSEYVAYVGIIGLVLALIGVWAGRRDPKLAGLALLAGVGISLALGAYNPVYWLLVKVVPGFRLFRAPARWLVLWAFGAAGLAGAGLDRLSATAPTRATWRDGWPGLIVVALAGLSLLAPLDANEVSGAAAPSRMEWIVWAVSALVAVGLAIWIRTAGPQRQHYLSTRISALAIIELFLASQTLPFNHLSAPAAWSDQRPAISTLLAAQRNQIPPSRFLSISDIRFDPGDLQEIEAIYRPYLDDDQLYDLVVAAKQKEILAPDLPLYWHIPAMDGFDGGVLPTRDYTRFTSLFLDEKALSPDGRLRENLKAVPDLAWLRLAGVRWIITDKVYDAWVDGVYYDLQFPARQQGSASGPPPPPSQAYPDQPFVANQVGIIGHIEGASQPADGAQVGTVAIYPQGAANPQAATVLPLIVDNSTPGAFTSIDRAAPKQAGFFTPGDPALKEYQVSVRWSEPRSIEHVEISVASSFAGTLVIRGVTLIDGRSHAFMPTTVSSGNTLRMANSGDVKIYQYRGALPRAYVVCDATIVGADSEMWNELKNFPQDGKTVIEDPSAKIVPPCDSAAPGTAEIVDYQPQRVTLQASATGDSSYLVLSDAWYPGWEATLDGQSVQILRSNGMFRAVKILSGSHEVVFRYRSRGFETGSVISLVCLIGTLTVLIVRWPGRKPAT